MDKEIELMKAIENQVFQVHYKQDLDMLLLLLFDQNEVKLLLNNLNHRESSLLTKFQHEDKAFRFSVIIYYPV